MKTPVLLLGFNRLDTFQKTLVNLRKVKPERVYIACDGPRTVEEKVKTDAVRQYLLTEINWTTDIKKLFRDENSGCGKAVNTAIDWFFDNEERGIILEDDCLVSESFFAFAEEMLDRYADNETIMHIGAANLYPRPNQTTDSYFFAAVPHIWGWATWRRAWHRYSVEHLKTIRDSDFFDVSHFNKITKAFWTKIFNQVYNGQIDTWDYQWLATLWQHQGLAVIPAHNMVQNIGFGVGATHTTNLKDSNARLTAHEIMWPLRHPANIEANSNYLNDYTYMKPVSKTRKILRFAKSKVMKHVKRR